MAEKNLRRSRAKMRPWTSVELKALREHGSLGAAALAAELGRTVSAVKCAANRYGVSLRRPRERRGCLLGQPRGVRLAELLPHEDDPHVRALVIARAALDHEAELCPSCGTRPIRVPRSGLCWPCHHRRLAALHREAVDEIAAQRDLWAARQELKRQRDEFARLETSR